MAYVSERRKRFVKSDSKSEEKVQSKPKSGEYVSSRRQQILNPTAVKPIEAKNEDIPPKKEELKPKLSSKLQEIVDGKFKSPLETASQKQLEQNNLTSQKSLNSAFNTLPKQTERIYKVPAPISFATGLADTASMGLIETQANRNTNPKGLPKLDSGKPSVKDFFDTAKLQNPKSYMGGQLAGYLVPGMGIEHGATTLLKPLLKGTGKLAGKVVTGAVTGGAQELIEGGIRGFGDGDITGQDFKDIGKRAAQGTVLGVGGELALAGAGKVAKKIIGNKLTPKVSEIPAEGLNDVLSVENKTNTITPPISKELPKKNVASNVDGSVLNVPVKKKTIKLDDGLPKTKFNQTIAKSDKTTPELSKKLEELDLGYDEVTNKKSLEQANKRILEDSEKAVRFVLDNKEPSAEHTATAIQLINKFQNEGNFERAVDIASDISTKLTKNGQAIQAASMYDRLSPEGILLYAQRKVNKLNDERWFKGLTKEQKIDPNLAKQLQELSTKMKGLTGDAKIEASQELQQALQALGKSTVGRKIESTQTIGQLLNSKTIVRNTIGNELFYRLERFNKYVATPIDIARSAITGADRTVTFKTAGQSGYWEGFLKGSKAGWKGVNPAGLQTQFDLTAPAFKNKWNPLTYMEKALGATLKGFDYAAYTRAVNNTIGEMAELKAINQGLKGEVRKIAVKEFAKTSEKNILDIADQYGKYITFQDDNVLSKGLSAVKRGLNAGKDFGVGSLIIKYPKTPGSLIMRGLDYSAAGFLKSAYEVAKPLLKGGKIDTREATMALSRAITGTLGFTGLGYYLADNGVITGRTDKDRDVRELQKQTGAGSYKVNLSALKRWAIGGFNTEDLKLQDNDMLYSYDWAQPIAMAISFGANINKNINENEGALTNFGATAASSLEGALGTIAEQPVLQGLTRQFQGYDLGQNAIQTAQGIPSSFTPTALNHIRQLSDNTGRSTYNPSPLKESLNMAQVKIPGKSAQLPANYDTLGKQKENYQNGSNSILNVLFNPGFVSRNKPTPVQKEILRLYETTGNKTQFPRVISDKISYTKDKTDKSYTFTQEEKPQYQKEVGELVQQGISKLLFDPNYKSATDAEKVKKVYNVLNDASEKAKNDFLKRKGLK